jgi:hypothetical protein
LAATEVLQEHSYIISIDIGITVNITIAGITVGTGIIIYASAKVAQEPSYIICVHTTRAIKITFTIAGIPDAVAPWGVGVFLVWVIM